MLRPIKDHHTVIKQQLDTPPNATKSNDIFLIPGNDEIVQHIRPINKSGPQNIFALGIKKDEFK